MKRLTPLVAGALILTACAAGPIVSDDFEEELPVADQPAVPEIVEDLQPELEVPAGEPDRAHNEANEEPMVLEPDDEEQEAVEPPASAVPTSVTTHLPPSDGEIPSGLLGSLVEHAAMELGVEVADVMVESASPWSWPDTAFGCPEDGKLYNQVVTDGYWVVASFGSQIVDMRVGLDGSVFECKAALPEGREP